MRVFVVGLFDWPAISTDELSLDAGGFEGSLGSIVAGGAERLQVCRIVEERFVALVGCSMVTDGRVVGFPALACADDAAVPAGEPVSNERGLS